MSNLSLQANLISILRENILLCISWLFWLIIVFCIRFNFEIDLCLFYKLVLLGETEGMFKYGCLASLRLRALFLREQGTRWNFQQQSRFTPSHRIFHLSAMVVGHYVFKQRAVGIKDGTNCQRIHSVSAINYALGFSFCSGSLNQLRESNVTGLLSSVSSRIGGHKESKSISLVSSRSQNWL